MRCVRELLSQGVDIAILFTHEDDPGESQWFGSVKQLAKEHGVRVETPDDPNTPYWVAEGRRGRAGISLFLLLSLPVESPLAGGAKQGSAQYAWIAAAQYRGRAPIHWAIIHGETTTGASLHYMLEKPDAGALVDSQSVPILENDNALQVSEKVADAAQQVLHRSLPALMAGNRRGTALGSRAGLVFRAPPPRRWPYRLAANARQVHNLVRAVAPPFPAPLPRSTGVGLRYWRLGWTSSQDATRRVRRVCMRRMMCGTPIVSMAGVSEFSN